MYFLSPYFLILLVVIPILIYFYIKSRNKHVDTIYFPRTEMSNVLKSKSSSKYKDIPFILSIISIIFMVIALSNPVIMKYNSNAYKEGIYISLVNE